METLNGYKLLVWALVLGAVTNTYAPLLFGGMSNSTHDNSGIELLD